MSIRVVKRWPRTAYWVAGAFTTALCWSLAISASPMRRVLEGLVWVPFVILLVLAVLRWRGRKDVRPVAFAAGIGLVYLLVVGGLFFGPGIDNYLHRRSFDSAAWQRNDGWNTNWPARLSMVDDLLAHHQLRGLRRDSLERLLGPPDSTNYFSAPNNLVYGLGPERGLMRIDSEWLVVALGPDGRVTEARILRD